MTQHAECHAVPRQEPEPRPAFYRINRILLDDAAAMPLYQQIDLYGATLRLVCNARGDKRIKGYDMAIR